MTDSGGVNRPIGYWLRLVDSLLTERINTAQRRHSMTRVEWQILNVLREAAEPSASRVAEVMRPFASQDELDEVLVALTKRGWVEARAENRFALTRVGVEVFENAQQAQAAVREQLMSSVTTDEYLLVVAVLQRMATSLQAHDPGQGSPSGD